MSELEKFSGMAGVTTLGLDGNPFTQGGTVCREFKEAETHSPCLRDKELF